MSGWRPIWLLDSDYDLSGLRAGNDVLHGIEERELGPVIGLRLLHLQCHFGVDTLALAQRGADVTGLDFSGPAIEAARGLAAELGLASNFVQSEHLCGSSGFERRIRLRVHHLGDDRVAA